jgi:nucleotide-binding universal stress UspA family protein
METAMTEYACIAVGLDAGPKATARIKLATSLADRFGARLIGVGARNPIITTFSEAMEYSEVIAEHDARQAREDLRELDRIFHSAVGTYRHAALRTGSEIPNSFLIAQARAADLLVVGRQGRDDHRDWRFGVDPADVILRSGRPVLVAPPGADFLSAKRIVIAWSDSREARRAVSDAMPLLKGADETVIAAIGATHAEKVEVKDYLSTHGIDAEVAPERPRCEATIADELIALAAQVRADLIVSGAYGHSRTREWILGGVTRDLLDRAPMCCLMSH